MKSRLALIVMLVAIVAAIVVDRVAPAGSPDAQAVAPPRGAGVLGCPVGSWTSGTGQLALANVGDEPATVRVSLVPVRGARVRMDVITLAAETARMVTVGGRTRHPAGVIVEYTGGTVVASHNVVVPGRGAGTGVCASPGPAEIAVTPLRTLRAEATLSLLNVGAADADLDVEIYADGRLLTPQTLKGIRVSARSRRDIRVGDFAFDARTAVAVVRPRAGRVIAEGLVVSGEGISLVGGQVASATTVAVAGSTASGAAFSLGITGEDEATLDATLITPTDQGRASGVPPQMRGGGARTIRVEPQRNGASGAVTASVAVGSPIAGGMRWSRRAGSRVDEAAVEGVVPAARWAGVIRTPAESTNVRLLLVNPGEVPLDVRIRLFGTGIERSSRRIELVPGRLRAVSVASVAGTYGFAVEAGGAIAAVIQAPSSTARRTSFYNVAAPGMPQHPHDAVSVVVDPRAGIARHGPLRR